MNYSPGRSILIDKYQDGTLTVSVFKDIYIAERGSNGKLNDFIISQLNNFSQLPRSPCYLSLNYDFVILGYKTKVSLMPKKKRFNFTENRFIDSLVLANSVARTRKAVYSYAHNMNINLFGTFTFSSEYVDRKDIKQLKKIIGKFFNNLRSRFPEIQYLLVPEVHKLNIDKYGRCWHFHFIGYLPPELLTFSGVRQKGRKVYNLNCFKYGWTNLTFADSPKAVATYILKYIDKELCEVDFGKQRYLVSRNIPKSKRVFHDFIPLSSDDREEYETDDIKHFIENFGQYEFNFCNEYFFDIYGIESKLIKFIFKEV